MNIFAVCALNSLSLRCSSVHVGSMISSPLIIHSMKLFHSFINFKNWLLLRLIWVFWGSFLSSDFEIFGGNWLLRNLSKKWSSPLLLRVIWRSSTHHVVVSSLLDTGLESVSCFGSFGVGSSNFSSNLLFSGLLSRNNFRGSFNALLKNFSWIIWRSFNRNSWDA